MRNLHMTDTQTHDEPSKKSLEILALYNDSLQEWKNKGMPHEDTHDPVADKHRVVWSRPPDNTAVLPMVQELVGLVQAERQQKSIGPLVTPFFSQAPIQLHNLSENSEHTIGMDISDVFFMNTLTSVEPVGNQEYHEAFHKHVDESDWTLVINANTQLQGKGGQLQVQCPECYEMDADGKLQEKFCSLDGDKGSFAVFRKDTPHYVQACEAALEPQQGTTTILLVIMMVFRKNVETVQAQQCLL
jgi:hypothetical protein